MGAWRGLLIGAGLGFLLGKTGIHHSLLSILFVQPADATPLIAVCLGIVAAFCVLLEVLARLAAREQPCDPSVRTRFRGKVGIQQQRWPRTQQ